MTSRHSIVAFLAVAAIIGGIALKVERYAAPRPAPGAGFEARQMEVMVRYGWHKADDAESHGNAFRLLKLNKAGCANAVRLAVIGTTDGLDAYLRQQYGDDIAYLQHGQVFDRPDMIAYQFHEAKRIVVRAVGFKAGPRGIPIIALIGASAGAGTPCAGPASANWTEVFNS